MPNLLFENYDKIAESYSYPHLCQKVCAAVLLCFKSNFLISENSSQARYSGYDELKSTCIGNFLIRIILPFLHCGQQVMSMPVNRSIISLMLSLIFAGNVASGSINFLISRICFFLFV